jgi:uncharacterized protein YraI
MSANCVKFNAIPDRFESDIFQFLCQHLRQADGDYTVTGPFWVEDAHGGRQREIDGLIITPNCLFTIEAKNVAGRVVKEGLNTPLVVYTASGELVDFQERHEDPYQQADIQWKVLSNYLKGIFHVNIWVKSLLVFPSGSAIEAMEQLRDPAQQYTPVFLLSLDEVADFVQVFQPPDGVQLSRQSQDVLVKAIEKGEGSLTQIEKNLVANGRPLEKGKRPSSESAPQEKVVEDTAPGKWSLRRFIFALLLAGLAYFPLSIWLGTVASVGLTAVLFYLLYSRNSFLAVYTFLGSMTFGFFQAVLGAALLVALFAGVVWPLAIPAAWYLQNSDQGLDALPGIFSEGVEDVLESSDLSTPTMTPMPLPSPEPVDEPLLAATPTSEAAPPATTPTEAPAEPTATPEAEAAQRVRIVANSNVRVGPGTDFDIVAIVMKDEIFPLLGESDDKNWYQIQLEPGKEGWIGSTRVNLETGQ